MQESSYLILGLGENATLQEVESAYKALKDKYQRQCFEEGETGSFAAKMLSKIKLAYNDCLDDIRKKEFVGEGSIYDAVEKLIEDNKLNQAQTLLDNTEPRTGDWHYSQAHLFYKRNWFLDSKTQIEIALTLDPDNQKYKSTLDAINKMQANIDNQEKAQRQARAGYSAPQENGGSMAGDSICNYCASSLCCSVPCLFCFC